MGFFKKHRFSGATWFAPSASKVHRRFERQLGHLSSRREPTGSCIFWHRSCPLRGTKCLCDDYLWVRFSWLSFMFEWKLPPGADPQGGLVFCFGPGGDPRGDSRFTTIIQKSRSSTCQSRDLKWLSSAEKMFEKTQLLALCELRLVFFCRVSTSSGTSTMQLTQSGWTQLLWIASEFKTVAVGQSQPDGLRI